MHFLILHIIIIEPTHNNKTFASSKDSAQRAHPRSLIKVFAYRMCLLQPPAYPKRDNRERLLYWMDVEADLSLCWSHRSYCRFCRALAKIYHKENSMADIPLDSRDIQIITVDSRYYE